MINHGSEDEDGVLVQLLVVKHLGDDGEHLRRQAEHHLSLQAEYDGVEDGTIEGNINM